MVADNVGDGQGRATHAAADAAGDFAEAALAMTREAAGAAEDVASSASLAWEKSPARMT